MSLSALNINTQYPCHESNYLKAANRKILWIVIHYTGSNGSGKAHARYFMRQGLNKSAHYFVGYASEGAQIYQSVDPKDTAWHCGTTGTYYSPARNSTSIGIETCCHNDTSDQSAQSTGWYFDSETVDALVKLTKALMEEYAIGIDHVIRHYDVTHKVCPAMWLHDEDQWKAFKERLTSQDNVNGDEELPRYERLSDIPNDSGFRDVVETLMQAGIVNGDGSDPAGNNDVIDLSLDQVRSLVMVYRGGGFDKKLIAQGLEPAVKDSSAALA
jgi:hypothetical protein